MTFLLPLLLNLPIVGSLGSLRSYDGNCNENASLKLNFCSIEVFCDYSMLITLYKISGVHFRLLGTSGFRAKARNQRLTAASSRCLQNLEHENFTSSFGSLRQNIAPKSVPQVQHDYFSWFNQSNHWFVALSLTLPLPSLNLKLPNKERTACNDKNILYNDEKQSTTYIT